MAKLHVHKLVPMLVAATVASAALLAAAQPTEAANGAIFRAKRFWWFSHTDTWSDSSNPYIPSAGGKSGMNYEPPAVASLTNSVTPKPKMSRSSQPARPRIRWEPKN